MTLGWPLALAGLLALVIPPWIHLRRERELTRLAVSITRYVAAAAPPRRWRYRFEHPWLMAARMTLISAVVLWLAEPSLDAVQTPSTKTWTLVSPITNAARVAALRDDPNARWLSPGLPPLSARRPVPSPAGAWPELWAADRRAPADVSFVVVGPATAAQAAAQRPQPGRAVRWLSAAAEPGLLDTSTATVRLALLLALDADAAATATRIEQVASAWQTAGLPVDIERRDAARVAQIDRPTVWLSQRTLPDAAPVATPAPMPVVLTTNIEALDNERVHALAADGQVLAWQRIDRARALRVRRVPALASDSDAWRRADFADELLALLFDDAPWRAPDDAPIASTDLEPHGEASPRARRSLVPLTGALVLLLAIVERLLAARALANGSAA